MHTLTEWYENFKCVQPSGSPPSLQFTCSSPITYPTGLQLPESHSARCLNRVRHHQRRRRVVIGGPGSFRRRVHVRRTHTASVETQEK